MSNHTLSEKSIVTLTIHDSAGTVTKDLYERCIVTLTIHANARTATNMHTQVPLVRVSVTASLTVRITLTSPVNHISSAMFTQVPLVRVSLTVRVTLTVPGQPRIVSHAYSSTPCQSIPDHLISRYACVVKHAFQTNFPTLFQSAIYYKKLGGNSLLYSRQTP